MYDLYTAMMIIWSGEWVRESARKRIFLQLKIVYDFNLENKSGMEHIQKFTLKKCLLKLFFK